MRRGGGGGPGERASASACPIDARLPRIKLSSSGGARQLVFRIRNMRRAACRSRSEHLAVVVVVVFVVIVAAAVSATHVNSVVRRLTPANGLESSARISRVANKERRIPLVLRRSLDHRRTLAETRIPCSLTDKEERTKAVSERTSSSNKDFLFLPKVFLPLRFLSTAVRSTLVNDWNEPGASDAVIGG